jgi:competence ComEA-like helix-hairpin-helix protein
MNISDDAIDDFVRQWDESIDWTDDELATIRSILETISLHNGGRVKYDVELDAEVERQYFYRTVTDALQKVMNLYADSVTELDDGRYRVPAEGVTPTLDFLAPAEYVPKIDVNTASADELEPLLGIGPKTSERIVEYRRENGYFDEIAEIQNVEGIRSSDFEQHEYAITTSRAEWEAEFLSPALAEFESRRTFSAYLDLIRVSDGRFVAGGRGPDRREFKEVVIDELRRIREFVETNRYSEYDVPSRVNASTISEEFARRERVREMEAEASHDVTGVSVLDDTEYYHFLKELITESRKKIRIMMFFMRYEDERSYPTDELLDALRDASERGVDVKVILDRDAEGDVFQSRVINEEAFEFFEEHDIDVTYDFEDELNHSKLVVVDDGHTVVGSHNWTAGSFFAYDDKSFYVESPEFAAEMTGYFDELWREYTADTNAVFRDVGSLRSVQPGDADLLADEGIRTTLDYLVATATPGDRSGLGERTGIPENQILRWANFADLLRVRGIQENLAILLEEVGVDTVPELAQRNPEELSAEIHAASVSHPLAPLPSVEDVEDWVEQANQLGRKIEY